jgi:hypothetical protein
VSAPAKPQAAVREPEPHEQAGLTPVEYLLRRHRKGLVTGAAQPWASPWTPNWFGDLNGE